MFEEDRREMQSKASTWVNEKNELKEKKTKNKNVLCSLLRTTHERSRRTKVVHDPSKNGVAYSGTIYVSERGMSHGSTQALVVVIVISSR